MIKVSIIGATGFAGIELVRLLDSHKEVELETITSESNTGENISIIYPHLASRVENTLDTMVNIEPIADRSDVIFIALPHGHAMKIYPKIKDKNVKVIDLGGDYRFKNTNTFEKWYKTKHTDPTTEAVYGLTELNRDKVRKSKIVSNPGCYTTCSILSLVPLFKNELIKTKGVIIDAKSGTTGAGRGLNLANMYSSVNENFKAYGVATHRHTPEIEEIYSEYAKKEVMIQFTPHLLPIDRGILATCYADLKKGVTRENIKDAFEEMYGEEKFIRVRGEGVYPEIKYIRASNYVDIGWQIDERTGRIIVVTVLDNLVKGAAGQAIQNMNVMCGFEEAAGLDFLPVYP